MKLAKKLSKLFFVFSVLLFAFCLITNRAGIDKNAPRIAMDSEEIKVSIEDDKRELLKGVTASDAKDGDVTDSLVVESVSNFIEEGRRKVSIVAFDSDNNIARETRELVYTDYESPKFSLESPLRFSFGDSDYMKGLTAKDCMDGDITSKIRIKYEEELDYGSVGEYKLTYTVSNSAGDAIKLPVTVEFYNEETASISRPELSKYLIYLEKGKSFNPEKYIEGITGYAGGLTTSDIKIKNPVKSSEPGVYEVEYQLKDSEKRVGITRLIVIVEE